MLSFKQFIKEAEYNLATGKDQQAYAGMVNWKGIIVWSSPQKFLSLVHRLPAEHLAWPGTQKRINDLVAKIEKGQSLDPFVLEIERNKVIGHEGRHRAMACIILGIDKIPIFVYPRDYPRVPQWTPEMYAQVRSLNFAPEFSSIQEEFGVNIDI